MQLEICFTFVLTLYRELLEYFQNKEIIYESTEIDRDT